MARPPRRPSPPRMPPPAKFSWEDKVRFANAHERADVAEVMRLLGELPGMESQPPQYGTWIHQAAYEGSVAMVEFWLTRGLSVNENQPCGPSADGMSTPLHLARTEQMVRFLIGKGADRNAWCRLWGTPLHRAAVFRDPRPLQTLLELGADPSIADADGFTPLALAMRWNNRKAERILREAGAPLEGRSPQNVTPVVRTPPIIDLRRDLRRIERALLDAVDRFAIEHPDKTVTAVALAVSGIEGYVMIAIDTASFQNSPWDASYAEYNTVEFNDWEQAYQLADCGVQLTTVDGRPFPKTSFGDAQFQEPFFRAAIAALRTLQRSPTLSKLKRAADFTLGVEISSGDYAEFWQPQ